jgi:hypothetical protein
MNTGSQHNYAKKPAPERIAAPWALSGNHTPARIGIRTGALYVRCATLNFPLIPHTDIQQPTVPPNMKMDCQLKHGEQPQHSLKSGVAVWAVLLSLMMFVLPMTSNATEEPDYKVVQKLEEIEVREYAAYTVAEVVVAGTAAEAGNLAFPILAGYIFGKNKGDRKFAMTAPVTQTAQPVKLAMTAPVTQTAAPGGVLVQFVLPKGVTQASAPEPLDARVMLRDIAPTRVAVIRYSGFWSDANYNQHLEKLQDGLRAGGLTWIGEAVYSRYNPPFTPWFLRRNEIWLHLANTP